MPTRRTFLTTSSLAAVAALGRVSARDARLPRGRRASAKGSVFRDPPGARDPQLHAVALRALDAARAAGATYADVRITTTRWRTFDNEHPLVETEATALGVRALARGAWGFVARTDVTADIAAQLGRQAAAQAQVNAWPRVPPIQLIDHLPVATGEWTTPVHRDPFTVPPDEIQALIDDLVGKIAQQGDQFHSKVVFTFQRQEQTFASTEGAYTTQTLYTSLGGGPPHTNVWPSIIAIKVRDPETGKEGEYHVPGLTPVGAGYEVLEAAKWSAQVPAWCNNTMELLNAKPFDRQGSYDIVFDAAAMAGIVDGTFGAALEYDRAVGYEANAGGTSYLAPPRTILGTSWAPASVTITGDRTLPTGAATVRWDAEGVAPVPFPLVRAGVVVDYAQSREFVTELAPWYQQHGVPVRSNGCAAAESAGTVPLVCTPNLVLHPGAQDVSVADLVAGVEDGLAVFGGDVQMDIQQLSGRGHGAQVYAIRHGKLAEPIKDAVYDFRSQELWHNLVALGGAQSAAQVGRATSKGQPDQGTVHSVRAVAAHVRNVTVANTHSG